jgi:anti-sigma B factor antagonist
MEPSRTAPRPTNGVSPYRATVAELGRELLLLSVSGELDLYAEPELVHSLAAADGSGASTVIVDLSGVAFLDSTICGALVREAKRRRRAGGELVLVGNGSHATQALELAGIDRAVRLFPTLHGALETLLVGTRP